MQTKTYSYPQYNTAGSQTGYYGSAYYTQRPRYDAAGIEPLRTALDTYDGMRRKLAREGGTVSELRAMTQSLSHNFEITGVYGKSEAKLSKPDTVKKALSFTGQYDVHFEIRRLECGLPAYYLARVSRDWWGTYGLVVEDLYRSEDFAIEDPRFVKLMTGGRAEYYLRLAPFRDKVVEMLDTQKLGAQTPDANLPRKDKWGVPTPAKKQEDQVDSFSYTVGRNILQGAWHVDQRFSFMVADAFEAPLVKSAIELIYAILSIDLHALRRQLTGNLIRFFETVYPNEALVKLMNILPSLKDTQFAALSRDALAAYVGISDLFNQFLRTEVPWKTIETGRMPLWKLILANAKRLDRVAAQMNDTTELCEARRTLQTGAQEYVDCLLNL